MSEYHVVWAIDVEADDHIGAAEEALRIMRDHNSIATVFKVSESVPEVTVDLVDRSTDEEDAEEYDPDAYFEPSEVGSTYGER